MIKKVGSCWYVARSNREELFQKANDKRLREKVIGMDGFYSYQVIKYNKRKETVTLIKSPDWLTANEPIVGDGIMISLKEKELVTKNVKQKKNPQIYHHKWLMVKPENAGFDYQKAMQRSKLLNEISSFHSKEVKCRCGYKKYWEQWCKDNGIEL